MWILDGASREHGQFGAIEEVECAGLQSFGGAGTKHRQFEVSHVVVVVKMYILDGSSSEHKNLKCLTMLYLPERGSLTKLIRCIGDLKGQEIVD
jgi:hypothetical protein